MDGGFKPITEVQEAETRAAKLLEKANRDRESALIDAKAQAAKLIENAEARAKEQRSGKVAKTVEALDARKKEAIEAAVADAKSYKAKRLNKTERARVVKELVDMVLGA